MPIALKKARGREWPSSRMKRGSLTARDRERRRYLMTIMNEVLLQVKVLYSKLSASKSLLSAI